ncbi:MAG: DNA primase [Candidatus Bathyarchaeia archaeon]
MRYSSIEERRRFYQEEFALRLLEERFKNRRNTVFALVIGRHTGIYPPNYEKLKNHTIIIDEYQDLSEVKNYILQYLPESVYYDRNLYGGELENCRRCPKSYRDCWKCKEFKGQELAFDLDPENIHCPYHGNIEDRMRKHQGLSFCMYEFKVIRGRTRQLYEKLERRYGLVEVTYSGRGFHLTVQNEDATNMGWAERKRLAKEFSAEYPIDEWVTSGEMRLLRLPYSLHGVVSRICIPLKVDDLEDFDPRVDGRCLPRFLLKQSSQP